MMPIQRTLWIATEIYYPEETSTAYFLTKLAEQLALAGRVAVLCAQPSYERQGHRAPQRESVNGVSVVRVPHPGLNRNSLIGRALNILSVTLRMFFKAYQELRRGDVVIGVTNPPFLPFAIYAAAALRRVSVVLLVHDLYPETAILAGVISPDGVTAWVWRRANNWLFRRVARIVVLGRDAAELIASRMPAGVPPISVISNWADVDEVRPSPPSANALLQSLGLHEYFVIGYAGNMGRVQDIEMLIAAGRALRDRAPNVHMLFIGSGSKASLVAAAARESGSNITILAPRKRAEQDLFLNACHVGVMALAPGMAGVGVPSRFYNMLAAGRPVIAAVDADSEPARVIREDRVGIQTPPGDMTAFVQAIESVRGNPSFLREAGSRARRVAVERFGFARTITAYRQLLAELGWESGER